VALNEVEPLTSPESASDRHVTRIPFPTCHPLAGSTTGGVMVNDGFNAAWRRSP
jgi:hypothetical protein